MFYIVYGAQRLRFVICLINQMIDWLIDLSYNWVILNNLLSVRWKAKNKIKSVVTTFSLWNISTKANRIKFYLLIG